MRTMRYVGQVDYLLGMHALTMSHPDKEDYVVAQFTPARAGTLCYGWTPFMRVCFEEIDTVEGETTVSDWIDVTELGSAYEAQFDPLTNRTRHRPLPCYKYGADGRVVKASSPEDWTDGPAPVEMCCGKSITWGPEDWTDGPAPDRRGER